MDNDRNQVNLELAKQKVEDAKDELQDVVNEIPSLRPEILIANAERNAVMELLIGNEICTRVQYYNTVAACLETTVVELQDQHDLGDEPDGE